MKKKTNKKTTFYFFSLSLLIQNMALSSSFGVEEEKTTMQKISNLETYVDKLIEKGTKEASIYYCIQPDANGNCSPNLSPFTKKNEHGLIFLSPTNTATEATSHCCKNIEFSCTENTDCKTEMENLINQADHECLDGATKAISCCHQPQTCSGATFTQMTDLVAQLSHVFSGSLSISQQCKKYQQIFGLMGVKSGVLAAQCKRGASRCASQCSHSASQIIQHLSDTCGLETNLEPIFERQNFSAQSALSITDPNFQVMGALGRGGSSHRTRTNNNRVYKELDKAYAKNIAKVRCSHEFFKSTYKRILDTKRTSVFYAPRVCSLSSEQSNTHIGNVVENILKGLAMQAANCRDQTKPSDPPPNIPTPPAPPPDLPPPTSTGSGGRINQPTPPTTSTTNGPDFEDSLFDQVEKSPFGPNSGGSPSGLVGPRGGGGGAMGGGGGGGGQAGGRRNSKRKGSAKNPDILLGVRSGKFAGYGSSGGSSFNEDPEKQGPWSGKNEPKKRLASLDLKKLLPKDKKLGHLNKAFGSPHDNIFQRVSHRVKWMCQTNKISCR